MERPDSRRRRLDIQSVVRAAKHNADIRIAGAFALARLVDGRHHIVVGDEQPPDGSVIIARFVRRGLRWMRVHEQEHGNVNVG